MPQIVLRKDPTIGNLKEVVENLQLSYRYYRADVTFRAQVDSVIKEIDTCMDMMYVQTQATNLRGLRKDNTPLSIPEAFLFRTLEMLQAIAY